MNRKIGTLWILTGLLSSLLYAQSWRGAEAVALQVNDGKGRPVPGARVVFTFQGIPGELGPDIVATDGKGRAVVAELAPGPWQVEVVHPDYLSFIAMIDVRRDKKPLISASFLEAGGRSLNPVKVKVSKGDERQASPVLETRAPAMQIAEAPPPAPEPQEPISQPRAKPETPITAVAEPESASVEEPEAGLLAVADEAEPEKAPPAPEPEAGSSGTPEAVVAEPVTAPEEIRDLEETAESEPGLEARVEESAPDPDPAGAAAAVAAVGATTSQATETRSDSPPMAEPTVEELTVEEPTVEEPTVEPSASAELAVPLEVEAPPVVTPLDLPQTEVEPEPVEIPASRPDEAPAADDLLEDVAPAEQPAVEAEPTRAPEVEAPQVTPPPVPVAAAPSAPTAAVSALPAPADTGVLVTSHRDGSCPDCETAEWTLQISSSVPAVGSGSGGSCDSGVLEAAQPAMQQLATSIQLELQGFIGPVANGTAQEAIRRAESDLAAPFQGPLAAFVGGTSPCQIVGLVLPKEVRFSRVTYAASDNQGSGACTPGQLCSIGDAAWLGSARVERGPSATVVYGLFENRSNERERRAFLTAYYRPPSARWQPRIPAAD